MRYRHFRPMDGWNTSKLQKGGATVCVSMKDRVAGIAFCSSADSFNKSWGRSKSHYRATLGLVKKNDPVNTINQDDFVIVYPNVHHKTNEFGNAVAFAIRSSLKSGAREIRIIREDKK